VAVSFYAYHTAPRQQLEHYKLLPANCDTASPFCDAPWSQHSEPCGVWSPSSVSESENQGGQGDADPSSGHGSGDTHSAADLKFHCEAEHTMMNLRRNEDDDRSTACLAWCVLDLLSIRDAFLEKNDLSKDVYLSEPLAKAMWNEDLRFFRGRNA
jgi:hypothetical protein